MAVRIKLEEGPDLLIRATLTEVTSALAAAHESGEALPVKTSNGTFELKPERVLSVTTEPDPEPMENGASEHSATAEAAPAT